MRKNRSAIGQFFDPNGDPVTDRVLISMWIDPPTSGSTSAWGGTFQPTGMRVTSLVDETLQLRLAAGRVASCALSHIGPGSDGAIVATFEGVGQLPDGLL